MLRAKYVVGVLVIVGATILVNEQLRGTDGLPQFTDPNTDLKRRIEALEDRVAALEAALAAKYILPQTLTKPHRYPLKNEPRYWDKREFNGQTVYIVPLSETESGSRADATTR